MFDWKRILQLIGEFHGVNEWVSIFLRAVVLKAYSPTECIKSPRVALIFLLVFFSSFYSCKPSVLLNNRTIDKVVKSSAP